jgi:hypothetical protein
MSMRRCFRSLALCLFLTVTAVYAQNNRSAVSITGVDTAACTVPDPCRTFGVALSKTNAGGEVVALTSGGYGPFTADRAATVLAAPGVYAALVASSGDAVLINAGTGARVVIRNLALYGMGTGSAGISATVSGEEIHIENCTIDGFANYGVISFLNFTMADTTVRHCGNGVWVDNAGAVVKAHLEHLLIEDTAGTGLLVARNATVTARNTAIIRSNVGFYAEQGGIVFLENALATRSLIGIWSNSTAVMRISNCVVTDNTTGVNATGTIETFTNNKISGNGTQVSGTLTAVAQQ